MNSDSSFECNLCDFQTALYTELLKHKNSHGDTLTHIPAEEMFMNIVIKQQQNILGSISKTNLKIDKDVHELRVNQDHIYDKVSKLVETCEVVHEKPNVRKRKGILLVGDTITRSINTSVVKNVVDTDFTRVEAISVDKDGEKPCFVDIVPQELEKNEYSTLLLQGGSHEITNLDMSLNIESLKQIVKQSSISLFNLAEKSLHQHL